MKANNIRKSLWAISDKLLSLFFIAMAVSGLVLALAFEHTHILLAFFGFTRFFLFGYLLYQHQTRRNELKTLRHSAFCLKTAGVFILIETIPLFLGMVTNNTLSMGGGILIILCMILIEIILSYRIGMIEEILTTAKEIKSKEDK